MPSYIYDTGWEKWPALQWWRVEQMASWRFVKTRVPSPSWCGMPSDLGTTS